MAAHEHIETNQNQDSWLTRQRWIGYAALTAIAYYLFTEHRQHVVAYLPFLFLAACPLMHMFMHRGHHHRHDDANHEQQEKKS